jgi:hypothetical protein
MQEISLVKSVHILCGIALARSTMMVARVLAASCVVSLGFFTPNLVRLRDQQLSLAKSARFLIML